MSRAVGVKALPAVPAGRRWPMGEGCSACGEGCDEGFTAERKCFVDQDEVKIGYGDQTVYSKAGARQAASAPLGGQSPGRPARLTPSPVTWADGLFRPTGSSLASRVRLTPKPARPRRRAARRGGRARARPSAAPGRSRAARPPWAARGRAGVEQWRSVLACLWAHHGMFSEPFCGLRGSFSEPVWPRPSRFDASGSCSRNMLSVLSKCLGFRIISR
ncbi:unnamed protein product [Prorocentrum cordatum]|uniref:Uncharacterized protein n=1 Tax=Prorocentrum cordatum TaxID=2364126 RepID=A0ABN9YCN6_9DINO|nr:unnamed protein product [Polarella glacialis]